MVVRCGAALILALSISTSVSAALVSYSSSLSSSPTDWTASVTVPKFDPGLGTLDSIEFALSGVVDGSIQFESLDASGATVTTSLSAMVVLMRPDFTVLSSVAPGLSHMDPVSAFDGSIDFDGSSGRAYLNQSASASAALTASTPSPDLALFTGAGFITLPVSATGLAAADGAGNLLVSFSTMASADVSVTYNYTVPEPMTLVLLSLAAFRRKCSLR